MELELDGGSVASATKEQEPKRYLLPTAFQYVLFESTHCVKQVLRCMTVLTAADVERQQKQRSSHVVTNGNNGTGLNNIHETPLHVHMWNRHSVLMC